MPTPLLNLRRPSLARGNILVFTSVVLAILISRFPHVQPSIFLLIPTLLSFVGTAETVRCIQRRWSFYHAGVILCIYMDLMAVSLILFFLLYPYFLWITAH